MIKVTYKCEGRPHISRELCVCGAYNSICINAACRADKMSRDQCQTRPASRCLVVFFVVVVCLPFRQRVRACGSCAPIWSMMPEVFCLHSPPSFTHRAALIPLRHNKSAMYANTHTHAVSCTCWPFHTLFARRTRVRRADMHMVRKATTQQHTHALTHKNQSMLCVLGRGQNCHTLRAHRWRARSSANK